MNDRQKSKLFWTLKGSLVAVLLYVATAAILGPSQLDVGIEPKAASGDEDGHGSVPMEAEPPAPGDYSTIVDNDLFAGPTQETRADEPAQEIVVAETLPSAEELGLRLIGTVAGSRVASRAIIENTASKTAGPYRIGSTVASIPIASPMITFVPCPDALASAIAFTGLNFFAV